MVVPISNLIDFLVSRMAQSRSMVISCDVDSDDEKIVVDLQEEPRFEKSA